MNIRVLFFVLSSIISAYSIAQVKDSLASKSFDELNALTNQLFTKDLTQGEKVAQFYVAKAKKENNQKEEFKALNRLINIRIYQRNFDGFVYEKERLLSLAKEFNWQKELMFAHYGFGNSYFFQGVLRESIESYNKAVEISEELEDLRLKVAALTQLGSIKSFIGDHEGAIKDQKEALRINEANKEEKDSVLENARLRSKVASFYFISNTYLKIRKRDSAKFYAEKSIALNQKVKDTCLNKALYRTLAFSNILYNDFDKAIANLDVSKTMCQPMTKGEMLLFTAAYGQAYIGQKKYEEAIRVLKDGLDKYQVKPEEEGFMEDHYKLLAKAYKYAGNLEQSNVYFEKYIHTTEEFKKIQDKAVSVFKEEELKEFQAELESINSEKNTLKYGILVACLFVLILSIIIFRSNRKKQNELGPSENDSEEPDASKQITSTSEVESSNDIGPEIRTQILTGLQRLEAKEYFLQQECNAYNVAKKIKTNTSYLSKVINSHYHKNFNAYINDLRINYAVARLKNDRQFRQFSIQSIAKEIGYKSADSFAKYFKKQTGSNPSVYIKKLDKTS